MGVEMCCIKWGRGHGVTKVKSVFGHTLASFKIGRISEPVCQKCGLLVLGMEPVF